MIKQGYPILRSFKKIFFLYRDGDITTLEVDAITNTTDETLTESNIISERILNVAGNQLKEDLTHNIRGKFHYITFYVRICHVLH